jgi:hypothetical protein
MSSATKNWKNFTIWRGKLPHWRADGVMYYVTFRHSRPLDERERSVLFAHLLRPDGKRWDLSVLCVLPQSTELVFTVRNSALGRPFELSDIVEKAKKKAGAAIIKKSGERWAPFYGESFDRIIRDEEELKERFMAILSAPVEQGLTGSPEEYATLFVSGI